MYCKQIYTSNQMSYNFCLSRSFFTNTIRKPFTRTLIHRPRFLNLNNTLYGQIKGIQNPTVTKRLPYIKSFSSDILLYDLSYIDIFTLGVWKNLLMLQLPSMLIYRTMKFSLHQMSYFLLFNALLKCIVDLYVVS